MTWSHIETFVRVAEAGSLSAAAKDLQQSQPTLSRQIQAFESSLGVQLFVRHARGLKLTERGAELLQQAQGLDHDVQVFLRRASGMRQEPQGNVRISAAEPIAVFALPPALAQLRSAYPKIGLELVVDNGTANLSRREADIAVRMFRPTQLDLVAKQIGSVEMGLYASRDYLARHGDLKHIEDISHHTLIGFDKDNLWDDALQRMRLRPEHFAVRTDSLLAQVQYTREGVGLGALHVPLATRDPGLVRVLPELPLGALELWLVVHSDVRTNPAVRVVLAALEEQLRVYAGE
ncbi:MAG: LysR family transcriptional regulator [Deltaproteobacteria bacterium]|nr:LysR family transcriptional regulator [Deltaproteobacteria bacterium]